MNRKLLYLECNSGISGDMTVASLIDLGADVKKLLEVLDSLQLDGFEIRIEKVQKCGIEACKFCVDLKEEENHLHRSHRNIRDIYKIIENMGGTQRAKNLAQKMFFIVAEAEAKAHGIPMKQVHFHEVGAVDSIVDIVSTAVCIDDLDIEDVVVGSLSEGTGTVLCRHGVLPVPVPAVVNIAKAYGLPITITNETGEMITPTGAAIAAALKTRETPPASFRIVKMGIGAGTKDFHRANILRAMLLEETERIWVLETNMDDCTGEALGYVLEKLMKAGAKDAYYTPVFMKKNRPAYLLCVIAAEKEIGELEDIIFKHTTTIGIRKYPVERTTLEREVRWVKTPYGKVKVKQCSRQEQLVLYPEYESVKEICEATGKGFQEVYYEIKKAAKEDAEEKKDEF